MACPYSNNGFKIIIKKKRCVQGTAWMESGRSRHPPRGHPGLPWRFVGSSAMWNASLDAGGSHQSIHGPVVGAPRRAGGGQAEPGALDRTAQAEVQARPGQVDGDDEQGWEDGHPAQVVVFFFER